MAKIHAILQKLEFESDADFRGRCVNFLICSEFPSAVTYGAIAIGRMTLVDGKHLDPDMRWGLAHTGPLPDQKCIIASYTLTEARSTLYKVDVAQLRRAPINPQTFPRLAHQMSLDEFSASINFKNMGRKNHLDAGSSDEAWAVFLDGVNLGEYGCPQLDAVRLAHKEQVRLALERCISPGVDSSSILPSGKALVWHPEFKKSYEREFALAKPVLSWTEEMTNASCAEGWNIFPLSLPDGSYEAYKGIRVVLDKSKKVELKDIESAWFLIATGQGSNHLIARTILATLSPMEYHQMMESARDSGSELTQKRERELT